MANADAFIKPEYPLSKITGQIIAAAQQVHQELGPGFMEVIYQRALALELPVHGLGFEREVTMDVHYKDQVVGQKRIDFVIEGVMVEIKAKAITEDVAMIQTLSYLKASGYKIGLLLNFGMKRLDIHRFINH